MKLYLLPIKIAVTSVSICLLFSPLMVNAEKDALKKEVQHLRQRVSKLRIDMQKNDLSLKKTIEVLQKKVEALSALPPPSTNQANLLQQRQDKDEKIEALERQSPLPSENTSEGITPSTPSSVQSTPITSAEETNAQTTPSKDQRAEKLYNQGIHLLSNSDYQAAEKTFTKFIKKYPQNKRIANARYWLGESFYYQNRFKPAFLEYNIIVKDFSSNPRSGQALLKSGFSKMELEEYGEAERIFNLVIKKYPQSKLSKEANYKLGLIGILKKQN